MRLEAWNDDAPKGNARRPSLCGTVIRDRRAAGVLLAFDGLAGRAGHDPHHIGGGALAGLSRLHRRSPAIIAPSPDGSARGRIIRKRTVQAYKAVRPARRVRADP